MPTIHNRQQHAAILLSRQPLQPSGNSPWVKQVISAVRWLKKRDYILCSSVGMQTWELITAVAALEKVPLKIFTFDGHEPCNEAEVAYQFEMDTALFTLAELRSGESRSREEALSQRDERIVMSADILIPISIKPRGNMSRLMGSSRDKEILREFEIEHETREKPLAYRLTDDQLSEEIKAVGDSYITHWTRSYHRPWPDERLIDYYRAILASDKYPRNAFETLKRMAAARMIIASSRHMPRNEPTVSFSDLPPRELVPLMRWRARYSQMSFEPYGIGIKRERAPELGILPVHYYDRKIEDCPADVPYWLTQSSGERSDWRQEREYRYRGGFRLDTISPDDLILFCRSMD
ncbi:MAG TPA: hypothetical protein VMS71_02605, partial [Candidatus Acidoferrum sp.]|nr:hypothetical protein [Candidatus Acidoferrum sp.]